ncbi:neural Wiskott-Aldrich syndrome [Brachionus plicatilis]|uniref:Neural Wiskott-Aldrich syndrome n=1 Tax=Brachionus plicatilis TaxID=10195 RepID=A0A3M7SQF2_BRAPC|nr:neural Wiskott-Aldrich syndrome [Brachionus plicatilis]
MSTFRRKNLMGGLVELNQSQGPSHTEWKTIISGKLVFQKDYGKKSYFFRLYPVDSNTKSNDFVWEHEMYTPFKYFKLNNLFHYFPSQNCYVGFNFSLDEHASKFYAIINSISQTRAQLYQNKLKSDQKTFFKNRLKDAKIFTSLLKTKSKQEKIRASIENVKKSFINLPGEKKISQSEMINLAKQNLEISSSAPPPPPLPTGIFQEPVRVLRAEKPIEKKPLIVDHQQALLSSIRNFKGFQPKERQQAISPKETPQDLNNQLKNAIVSRQIFFKQSSDESESDIKSDNSRCALLKINEEKLTDPRFAHRESDLFLNYIYQWLFQIQFIFNLFCIPIKVIAFHFYFLNRSTQKISRSKHYLSKNRQFFSIINTNFARNKN